MSAVRCNMPKTRTSACRYCLWTQASPGMGIMEVHEGRTPDRCKPTGYYLVQEFPPTYCRRFKVTKRAGDGGETYWVSIGDNFTEDSCDCDGFTSAAVCKHRDGIRALIDAGKLIARSDDPVQCLYADVDYMIGDVD